MKETNFMLFWLMNAWDQSRIAGSGCVGNQLYGQGVELR